MTQTLPKHKYTILSIFIFSLLIQGKPQMFSRNLSQKSLGLKKEKLTHIHFYFHDIVSGDHPTVVRVAKASITNTSHTVYGVVFVIDDLLTVGPKRTSNIVGRAQGLYAFADLNEIGLLMVLNYVFTEGKYNGSTLSILGRNSVVSSTREMPIDGETGLFRFARGYARAKTHFIDAIVAIVEYNVYVLHY